MDKKAGVSLLVSEEVDLLEPYWQDLDVVTIVGTRMGIKGATMEPSIPDKIRRARSIISERRLKTEIEADGGIRRDTVPLLHAAGADFIVPGSLMFGEDPPAMRRWLASL
jgi:ribulose-phosphate 3-epimerase